MLPGYTETVVNGRKIILDENGKPCRTCNSLQELMAAASGVPATAQTTQKPAYEQDPPDKTELGRGSWTLLHTLPKFYPEAADASEQKKMKTFLSLFGEFYPCPPCAADFQDYLEEHPPRVSGREELGQWLCEAHNEVNDKLGKPSFDCKTWRQRWLDGWSKK